MAWHVFNSGPAAAQQVVPQQNRVQSAHKAHNAAWELVIDPVVETTAVLHIAQPENLKAELLRLSTACAQWFAAGGRDISCFGPRTRVDLLAQLRDLGFRYHAPDLGAPRPVAAQHWWLVAAGTDPDHSWQVPASLADGVVALRPWQADDFSALEPAPLGAAAWWPPLAPTRFAEWLVDHNELLVTGQGQLWCVADAHSGHALGAIQLRYVRAGNCAELSALIFPSAQGRGAGTAATRLVADWAVRSRQLGGAELASLVATTPLGDVAAAGVLAAAGFDVAGRSSGQIASAGSVGEGTRWCRRQRPIR